MKLRSDLINYFIKKNKYETYLEIGTGKGRNFNIINVKHKEGVEIKKGYGQTHHMSSDQFFKQNDKKWDIIFIDGDHHRKQVAIDIENALNYLNEGGTIVCHDVNPKEEYLIEERFCGSGWEAFAELRATRTDLVMHGLTFDHVGFIQRGSQELFTGNIIYNWEYLNKNRIQLVNELETTEFLKRF